MQSRLSLKHIGTGIYNIQPVDIHQGGGQPTHLEKAKLTNHNEW